MVMGKLTVTYEHDLTAGYGLHFPYSPEMVRAIKERVAGPLRNWDPATKTWWIHTQADFEALRWATNGWAVFAPKKSVEPVS